MPKTSARAKPIKGQINRIIDTLAHSLFKKNPTYIILDSLLHAIVEQNPRKSIRKFIKYNLAAILDHLTKEH